MMRSSYKKEDVIFLLKDITGLVTPKPAEERERLIQQGRHYSEMLPVEYVPSEKYMETYREALHHFAKPVAQAVGNLADKIMAERRDGIVLVSLARAGTPVGVLLKRYFKQKYHIDTPHYSISIIRGRGIDKNAMAYLLERHNPRHLVFVDGWVGKGAIFSQLRQEIEAYPEVSAELAVVADPAGITKLYGTHEDILIPSSCLNSTVTGLVSRTFLRGDVIGEKDFHGAVYYGEFKNADLSYEFIHAIEEKFDFATEENQLCDDYTSGKNRPFQTGIEETKKIAAEFHVSDINLVKPGIGETTRALLRRVPWKVLIAKNHWRDPALKHLFRLAEEKNVPVAAYPLVRYKACGIIRRMADT